MNATMIKGERSKLLAVAVVIAMVACALVAFMPSESDAVEIPPNATEVSTYGDFANLESGVTDVKLTGPITIRDGQVLDLGNLNVYLNGNYITLNGGSISNGTIIGSDGRGIATYAGALTNVTFEEVRSPVMIYDGITGDITIEGCTFNKYTGANPSASAIYAVLSDGYTINVSNCHFNGTYREGDVNVDSQPTYSTKIVISTAENEDVSLNIVAENSDVSIGGEENAINISNASLDNVNISSGSLIIPTGEKLTAKSVTSVPIGDDPATGNIVAGTEQIDSDTVSVPVYASDNSTVTVYDYNSLESAIRGDADKIVLANDIGYDEDLVEGDIALGSKTLDLNGNQLSLGTFGITLDAGTITNGTITKTGGSSSNGIAVNVSGNSTIDGVNFVMTASEEGYMPFALSFSSGESIITKCNFTANGERFAVMQENFGTAGGTVTIKGSSFDNGIVVIKEYGKVDIQDSGGVIIGVGLYGGNTDITVPMNENTFTYSGTTNITETVIGWDPCTLGPDATYQGDITLAVDGNYDLGMITTGAVETNHQTNVLNIKSGNVTADGGYVHTLVIDKGASFDSNEMMNVELLTMHDASQIPDNVYPAYVNVTTSTGDRRPVASDFAVIQYTPTYYTGKATDALYYIARPSNVNVSVVTILDSGDDIKQIDVGDYTTQMRLSITYSFGTGGEESQDTTTVTLTFNWSILPAESVLEFDPDEVAIDPEDSTQITVSGDVTGTDGDYSIDVAVDPKIFDKNGRLVDATGGYTLTVNGDSATIVNGRITLPVDSLTGTTPVTIVYDADGNGTNYAATTYTVGFDKLTAVADVDFEVVTDENMGDLELGDNTETDEPWSNLWGKNPEDLYTDVTMVENDRRYTFTSGNVIYNWGFEYFSDDVALQSGWYIALKVNLPDVKEDWNGVYISTEKRTFTGAEGDVFDGWWYININDCVSNFKIKVDLDGDLDGGTYPAQTYTFDFTGLNYLADAWYYDNEAPEGQGQVYKDHGMDYANGGEGLKDVIGQTMFIAYENKAAGDVTLTITYPGEEEPIYIDTVEDITAGRHTLYLSFLQQIADQGWEFTGGQYTLIITDEEDNIIGQDTVNVPATLGYGYDESASNVITDVSVATGGEIVLPSDGVDGVAPETMWIAWYTAAQTTGATATLTWNGHEIFSETLDVWNEVNPHVWYFSFDKDNASFIGNQNVDVDGTGYWSDYESIRPGIYVMTVVDEKKNTLATGEIVIDGYADAHYEELTDDALKGMKFDGVDTSGMVADTPTGVAPETMWIAWYNSSEVTGISATLEWNGQVIFTEADDTATFAPGSHVWYFTFDKTNENFIGKDNDSWPWTDAEYTGIVGGEYKLTVRDAAGNLLAEGEYTHYDPDTYYIGFDEEGTEYDIVDLPLDHGYAIQMPGSAIEGMTVKYWNMVVDGEVVRTYNPGSMFVVGVSSPAKIITFVAVYNEPASEHTIQYWIAAALENAGYGFAASYVIDGGDVVAVYSDSEYGTAVMMNDFARYMGALYRVSEGDIVSVYFNGTEYVWKAEVGLDGSNWVEVDDNGDIVTSADSEGDVRPNTLVRAVTEYFQAGELYKNSIALELTNAAGDKAVLNYGLGIEDPASSDGYAKVRQLDDYYYSYAVDGNTITITLKTDKIEGYRNVLDTVNISWGAMFGSGGDGKELYIDEPGENGIVCQYSFTVTEEDISNVVFGNVEGYIAGHYVPLTEESATDTE